MTIDLNLDVVILAAGKGTRMNSAVPKMLQTIAKKPMIMHVVATAAKLNPRQIHIILGYKQQLVSDQIRIFFKAQSNILKKLNFLIQEQQLGTGNAVQVAVKDLQKNPQISNSKTLVLYGDVPLIKHNTLKNLLASLNENNKLSILGATMSNPFGYGRLLLKKNGYLKKIVEQKDANSDEQQINVVNTGIISADTSCLLSWLEQLRNNNVQQEYYLTDIVQIANVEGKDVVVIFVANNIEIEGVNNKSQLINLERKYQIQQAEKLIQTGVHIYDPKRIDIRGSLQIGIEVSIDINCIFEGKVALGNEVIIGANCILINCKIGNGVVIKPNCHIENCEVGENAIIGPFARIRSNVKIAEQAHIGNFVEIKNSTIGKGSKVNHLAYIGDTKMARNVNVGAGTITCNYDGITKHQTKIKSGAFIGSGTMLIAPIIIAKDAVVAAGSTITENVPSASLALARNKQTIVENWKNKKFNHSKKT